MDRRQETHEGFEIASLHVGSWVGRVRRTWSEDWRMSPALSPHPFKRRRQSLCRKKSCRTCQTLFSLPDPAAATAAWHSCTSTRALPLLPLLSTDFIADSEKSNMQLRTEMAPLSPSPLPLCQNWARLARAPWPRKSRSSRGYGRRRPSRHRGTTRMGQCRDKGLSWARA